MGGTLGEEPVAMTMRRASTRCSPAATWRGPAKRAEAAMTRTPSPSKRSTESVGAMAAMTPCTWRITAAKSTAGGSADRPKAPFWRAALGISLGQVGVLLGAFDLGALLLFLPIGMLADRWGEPRVLVAGALFTAAMTARKTRRTLAGSA
jgi:hypothetical protein